MSRIEDVISRVDQVTPEWLTDVLKRSGALDSGAVEACVAESRQSNWATIAKLRVTYTSGARGQLPERLFLKLVDTSAGESSLGPEFGFGRSEVDYYLVDYRGVAMAPLVRSYDAAYSPEMRRYHLLMDDLSRTHVRSVDKPVTLEHGLALAEGLAAMHAHLWGRERLASADKFLPTAEQIDRYVDIARPGMAPAIEYCADELEPHWPDVIREVFDKHPGAMAGRAHDGNGFTLIHGDVNRTNILVPIEGERPIYVIDRQPFDWSLITWLGAFDLSLPMVLWWDVETRRKHESAVLRRYHDGLVEHGVRGYSLDQLVRDYALSAVMGVYVAVEWCRSGVRKDQVWIWKPKLKRTLTAIDDLDCRAIWA